MHVVPELELLEFAQNSFFANHLVLGNGTKDGD